MPLKHFITTALILLLSVTSSVAAGKCKKTDARKAQVKRLSGLSADTEVDAVVTARFRYKNHDIYTFDLLETWPYFNAGLYAPEPDKEPCRFKVRVPENLIKCAPYNHLRAYYLILKKRPSYDNVDFKLLEPLVPTFMSNIRRKIYKAVCKDKDCPLVGVAKITDGDDWRSNNILAYEGFMSMTRCRVQTSLRSDEFKLEWFKDDLLVDPVKEVGKNRIQLKYEDGSLLLMMDAKQEFSGEYTCRVTVTEFKAEYEVVTKVSVVPRNEHYCQSHDHCNKKGICLISKSDWKKKCICNLGYEGDTCGTSTTDVDYE